MGARWDLGRAPCGIGQLYRAKANPSGAICDVIGVQHSMVVGLSMPGMSLIYDIRRTLPDMCLNAATVRLCCNVSVT
jgi:hypothetical protein